MLRVGVVQLCVGDDPAANLPTTLNLIETAVDQGATFVATPEVTNLISTDRGHQQDVLHTQQTDPTLQAIRNLAKKRSVTVLIGSLALKTEEERFANRSFLIAPDGSIIAWYDKIHMFDVALSTGETYHESKGYRAGDRVVLANAGFAKIGMTVCYDVRFPHLHRSLAKAGAQILTVPSAFSPITGAAHWNVLLRARAIETGCFVIAPAQTGQHVGRKTYGHSMVISPWGDVLLDAGKAVGVSCVDIDLSAVAEVRSRIPSLTANSPNLKVQHYG